MCGSVERSLGCLVHAPSAAPASSSLPSPPPFRSVPPCYAGYLSELIGHSSDPKDGTSHLSLMMMHYLIQVLPDQLHLHKRVLLGKSFERETLTLEDVGSPYTSFVAELRQRRHFGGDDIDDSDEDNDLTAVSDLGRRGIVM